MSENLESMCWDCPSRTGVARVCGTLATKFWRRADFTGSRVKEQRNGCEGKIPVREMSQGKGSFVDVGDEIVTVKIVTHDVYFADCPKEYETPPVSPDEVKAAMRVNGLDVFVHERTTIRERPREDYDQMKALLRASFEPALPQNP